MLRIIRLALLVITLTSALVLLWPRPGIVQASRLAACQNSITVSTNADGGAGSLRQALADVCSGGTVNFAAGLANQTITLTTTELSITKTVTITNPNAANLRVSGNNARRVFNIQAGAVVTISSLSVISGTAPVSCYFGFESCGGGIQVNSGATLNVISSTFSNNMASRGGGIYNEGILTLKNSIFNSNSASMGGGLYNKNVLIMNNSTLSNNSGGSYGGGGIYVEYTAIFTVTNSTLNNNSASSGGAVTNYGVLVLNNTSLISNTGGSGGGILNGGTMFVDSSILRGNSAAGDHGGIYNGGMLTLNNTTISNNSASGNGAIYNENGGVITITKSTISNNSALYGAGGINNEGTLLISNTAIISNNVSLPDPLVGNGGGIRNLRVLTITNSFLRGNSAANSTGGGIFNYWGSVMFSNSTLSENSASAGGSIYNYNGILTFNNSTISNNSASSDGGGIYNHNGILIFNNSIISGNSAVSYGGGIYNISQDIFLNNTSLSGNSAFVGGGIYNFSKGILHLYNDIIANSVNGGDCYNDSGTIATNVNNLIEDGTCNPALSGDPLLGPLADNGGSTLTHALLPGSPAINAGDNATCLATDQRGIARPQQGQCDIGAFESRGFRLTRSSGNNQSTAIGSVFPAPLVVSVSSGTGEPVSGGVVTLTGPGSGAGTSPVSTTAIISGATASTSVTANALAGGPYNVAASSKGASAVNFSLTNLKGTPTVTVTSSLNPSTVGQAVTLAATVSYTVGTPSGNVTFVIDGTPQAPVALVGGQASLTTSSLTVGNHTVSANYGGDTNFNTSSGSLLGGQTVNGTDAPTVQFTQAVYTTTENIGTSQNVILTRSGSLTNSSQVQVSLGGGTATAGSDYSSAGFPKTITFGSGVVSQTVPITITDDAVVEPTETISLTLTPLVNAVIGSQSSAVLQIQDNDAAPAPEAKVYLPVVLK